MDHQGSPQLLDRGRWRRLSASSFPRVELSRVKHTHHENRVETGAVPKRLSPLLPAEGDFHPVPGALPFPAGMSGPTPRQPPGLLPASIACTASRGPLGSTPRGSPRLPLCQGALRSHTRLLQTLRRAPGPSFSRTTTPRPCYSMRSQRVGHKNMCHFQSTQYMPGLAQWRQHLLI